MVTNLQSEYSYLSMSVWWLYSYHIDQDDRYTPRCQWG